MQKLSEAFKGVFFFSESKEDLSEESEVSAAKDYYTTTGEISAI